MLIRMSTCAPRFLRVLLLAASLATPGAASAQAAATPSAARELVVVGDKLQRLHLYEAALADYRRAYEMEPLASTLRRIAESERALGDVSDATASYERLLARRDLSRDDKKAAEKALTALAAETATLVITASPANAAVALDGQPVGLAPVKPYRVTAPGLHVVRVTMENFEPFVTTIDAAAGATQTVVVALAAEVTDGSIFIRDGRDRKVRFSIDGKEAGTTPFRGELRTGEHAIDVTEPRMRAPRVVVKVAAKQRIEAVVETEDTVGTVKLVPEPKDAEITIDGKIASRPPQGETEVSLGEHLFVAKATGHTTTSERLEVVAGRPLTWSPRLERVVVAAPAAPEEPDYEGGHFDVGLHGSFPIAGRVDTCPSPPTGSTCTAGTGGTALGGGLLLRAGYNFGVVGLDFTLLPSFHSLEDNVSYPGGATVPGVPEGSFKHAQTIKVLDLGGLVAVGPTFATHGRIARASGGIGAGVALRYVSLERTMTGSLVDDVSTSATRVGAGGVAHLSVLLGSTPGPKLELGVLVSAEGLDLSTAPIDRLVNGTKFTVRSYDVYKGVQVYLGPVISGRFGY